MDFDNRFDNGEELDLENRIMSTSYIREDNDGEASLRPKSLDEYVGQSKAKENLKVQRIHCFYAYLCIILQKTRS